MKKVQVIKPKKTKNEISATIKDTKIVVAYVRVSTDYTEQLNSYESQLKHYTELIQNTKGWGFGGVYADEGISGTQTKHRENFKRMVNDGLAGKFDLIITKSISRFARNTVDTLKYVRKLKAKGIGILFEKENINTLTMDGEVLLTILSSLAQQESESLSGNVRLGLKMKMQRGEIIGMPQCLGYDYDKINKKISINEKEAEIVRYIFRRYLEGAGGYIIAKELTEKEDWFTKRGNKKWDATSVINILKNEKYVGDLLLGKTVTLDPISHRKVKNMGESEMYLVKNHHDPIIERDKFEKVQEIFSKRSAETKENMKIRTKYSRKHAFSSITKCGYCNSRTTRRRWHKGKPYEKFVWQCANYLKNGRQSCLESRGIDEELIEKAFISTYNKLQENDMQSVEEYIKRFSEVLKDNDYTKELNEIDNKIKSLEEKINKLVDMRLENIIDENIYKNKHQAFAEELDNYRKAKEELKQANVGEETIKKRIKELENVLKKQNKIMKKFDRDVFDKIVDEVILGAKKENGEFNPYTIVFKLKTGISYVNEILFDETKTGGRSSYANYRIDTSSIYNKHTVLEFDFIYDFGYSIYKSHHEGRNGKINIDVIVII